jgi:hypothetical protein
VSAEVDVLWIGAGVAPRPSCLLFGEARIITAIAPERYEANDCI